MALTNFILFLCFTAVSATSNPEKLSLVMRNTSDYPCIRIFVHGKLLIPYIDKNNQTIASTIHLDNRIQKFISVTGVCDHGSNIFALKLLIPNACTLTFYFFKQYSKKSCNHLYGMSHITLWYTISNNSEYFINPLNVGFSHIVILQSLTEKPIRSRLGHFYSCNKSIIFQDLKDKSNIPVVLNISSIKMLAFELEPNGDFSSDGEDCQRTPTTSTRTILTATSSPTLPVIKKFVARGSGDKICLVVMLSLDLKIRYWTTNGVTAEKRFLSNASKLVESQCGKSQSITLSWSNQSVNYTYIFRETDGAHYTLFGVNLSYILKSSVFPNVKVPTASNIVLYNKTQYMFPIVSNKEYMYCDSRRLFVHANTTATVDSIRYQAFKNGHDDILSGKGISCEQHGNDNTESSVIVVIVFLIIGLIGVSIIVCHVVLRRRQRQPRYQYI